MTIKSVVGCAFLSTFCVTPILADSFDTDASYNVCFTPGGSCTDLIVDAIKSAQKSLRVQAYSFTSTPIIDALIDAQNRGIDVKIILDKTDFSGSNPVSEKLIEAKIPLWEDSKVAIAHNKVIIIDAQTVITGSFNYTASAQDRNAENVLIISDDKLAEEYNKNWESRERASATKD